MVIGRLKTLISAMFNKGMSQLETPEILAEQAQEQLEDSVKKVNQAVIESLTNEKMLQQKIKKGTEELAQWDKRAAAAVSQNNDDLARQCLQKKQELNQSVASLSQQLEQQTAATANLKTRQKELDEQAREFQRKKSTLTARGSASDAVSKANELLAGPGSTSDKWEQKIAEKEFKAQALNEMSGQPVADKIAELDKHMEVEDELAALKAKVSTPKLIVDTGAPPAPSKPVVDDNVPMVIAEPEDEDKDAGKK